MKKLILVLFFFPLISFGQKIKGEKLFSIKAAVGEWQSSVGEYLNLKTIYAPYTKGVFDGITNGKVLPIGGDYPLYHQEDGKTFSDLDHIYEPGKTVVTDGGSYSNNSGSTGFIRLQTPYNPKTHILIGTCYGDPCLLNKVEKYIETIIPIDY